MAIVFPTNPTIGLQFSYNGVTYTYTAQGVWLAVALPPGPPGPWTQITQAAYNALSPPNPATLYVIIG
jgi:hypothetical protein